ATEVSRLVHELWSSQGGPAGLADAALSIANEMEAHGNRPVADSIRAEAVRWLSTRWQKRVCHPQPGDGDWCDQLSRALYESRRWREASDRLRSMPLATDGGQYVSTLGRLGAIAIRLGDSSEAKRVAAELDRMTRPEWAEFVRWQRARLATLAGDTSAAMAR